MLLCLVIARAVALKLLSFIRSRMMGPNVSCFSGLLASRLNLSDNECMTAEFSRHRLLQPRTESPCTPGCRMRKLAAGTGLQTSRR